MKTRKWKALLRKDLKLTLGNKNIILLLLLPVIFALIYGNLFPTGEEHGPSVYDLINMVTQLGFGVIGSSIMAISIADEKEKKTLRSLMLSDVTGAEFIVSKMVIVLVLFLISMMACFFLLGGPVAYLPKYLAIVTLTTITLLFLSSIIGLLSANQQAAGVLGAPLMLFLMIPLFSMMGTNTLITALSKFLPTGPALFMINNEVSAGVPYNNLLGFGSMISWIALSLVLFIVIYKKKMSDN